MAKIIWTDQAVEDVKSIGDFICRDSPRYATLVTERIVLAVDRLQSFPLSGRVVPEFRDNGLREVVWRSYRIVYQVVQENVEVLTVYHGARMLDDPRT